MSRRPCETARCTRERDHHGPCITQHGNRWIDGAVRHDDDCRGCIAYDREDAPRRVRFHIDAVRSLEAAIAKSIGAGRRALSEDERDDLRYRAERVRAHAIRAVLAALMTLDLGFAQEDAA